MLVSEQMKMAQDMSKQYNFSNTLTNVLSFVFPWQILKTKQYTVSKITFGIHTFFLLKDRKDIYPLTTLATNFFCSLWQ